MSLTSRQSELLFRDWKNPAEYKMGEDVSVEQWAWEFLRRNSSYNEEWHKFVAQLMAFCGISKDEDDLPASDWIQIQVLCEWGDGLSVFVPAKDADESVEAWREKHGRAAKQMSLSRWLGNKWHLTDITDPKSDSGYMHFVPRPSIQYKLTKNGVSAGGGHSGIQEPPIEHLACETKILFDLYLSIDSQIEHVRNHLLFLQQSLRRLGDLESDKPSRLRTDKYLTYLRILDAVNAGATVKEIGEVLQPWKDDDYSSAHGRTKSIEMQLKEARRLVEGGYKALLGKLPTEK